MAHVKAHTRKTKKGPVGVKAHTRYYEKIYGYGQNQKGKYGLMQVGQLEVSPSHFSTLDQKRRFKERVAGADIRTTVENWKDLRKSVNKEYKTPSMMETLLRYGKTAGNFTQYGYSSKFLVLRETDDMWVVSAPKISRDGSIMGGSWYVSKKNPKRAVFD